MRSVLIFFLIAGVAAIGWLVLAKPAAKPSEEKQKALSVSRHSEVFNTSVATVMEQYANVDESLVKWDSVAATAAATALRLSLDKLSLDELKKDSSAIYETAVGLLDNAKGDAGTLAGEKNIRPQREAFNSLSDNLYQFLNTIKYDRQKLYLQECPMAFDETKPGHWLSKEESIRNPYMGLHHPTYGKGMIECGETKTVINNTPGK